MPAASIVLRLARPTDAPALSLMSRDLIEAGLGWRYRPESMARLIADRDTLVLVAAGARGVAGFCVMSFGAERAHLVLFAVRPSQQRSGIGRQMLDWLLASAAVAGTASIHLELRAANRDAHAFYRAMDFHDTVQVPGYYQAQEAALRMVRVLRAPGTVVEAWVPPW